MQILKIKKRKHTEVSCGLTPLIGGGCMNPGTASGGRPGGGRGGPGSRALAYGGTIP